MESVWHGSLPELFQRIVLTILICQLIPIHFWCSSHVNNEVVNYFWYVIVEIKKVSTNKSIGR